MLPARLAILAASSVLLLAGAPAAADAAISFDRACYQDTYAQATAAYTATGLPPLSAVHVALDGKDLGLVRTDASGTVQSTVAVPAHTGPDEESQHALTLTTADGLSVSGMLYTSSLTASFAPTRGDARTLRVRFNVFGMNLVSARSNVYVHYVAPNGRHKRTVSLGRAQGRCGRLVSTKKRALFPFSPQRGRWTLQFDTSRRYVAGSDASRYPWATIGVRVLPSAARR